MIDKVLLCELAQTFDIALTQNQLELMNQYARLLVEWNEKVNLTAIVEPEEIVIKHFLDSMLLTKAVELPQKAKLVDVGCGAGFPSVPCKILRPDLQVLLMDSLNKRILFLKELCKQLGLQANLLHGRAEEEGRKKELRESQDVATARAVAHLAELSEYCLPFVKVGGVFVALKGYEVEEELQESKNAIGMLGGRVVDIKKFLLPADNKRSMIVIEKISQTPTLYPRTPTKMSKSPIK